MSHPRNRTGALALLLLVALAAGCGSGHRGGPVGPEAGRQRVILISWDGAQAQHVSEAMGRGILPNLSQLASEGDMATVRITDHIPETLVAHVEMLTGYPPEVTGVFSPRPADRREVDARLFVMARLNRVLGHSDIYQIWVTSKGWHMGARPGDPFYHVRRAVDIFDANSDRPSGVTGPLAVRYLQAAAGWSGPVFAFVHFREPDVLGHAAGEDSSQYDVGLAGVDRWLGSIREALDLPGRDPPTTIMVTTDHGFEEGGYTHQGHSADVTDCFVACNRGPLTGGDQKDIVPTILSLYGIDGRQFSPPLPGRSLLANDN